MGCSSSCEQDAADSTRESGIVGPRSPKAPAAGKAFFPGTNQIGLGNDREGIEAAETPPFHRHPTCSTSLSDAISVNSPSSNGPSSFGRHNDRPRILVDTSVSSPEPHPDSSPNPDNDNFLHLARDDAPILPNMSGGSFSLLDQRAQDQTQDPNSDKAPVINTQLQLPIGKVEEASEESEVNPKDRIGSMTIDTSCVIDTTGTNNTKTTEVFIPQGCGGDSPLHNLHRRTILKGSTVPSTYNNPAPMKPSGHSQSHARKLSFTTTNSNNDVSYLPISCNSPAQPSPSTLSSELSFDALSPELSFDTQLDDNPVDKSVDKSVGNSNSNLSSKPKQIISRESTHSFHLDEFLELSDDLSDSSQDLIIRGVNPSHSHQTGIAPSKKRVSHSQPVSLNSSPVLAQTSSRQFRNPAKKSHSNRSNTSWLYPSDDDEFYQDEATDGLAPMSFSSTPLSFSRTFNRHRSPHLSLQLNLDSDDENENNENTNNNDSGQDEDVHPSEDILSRKRRAKRRSRIEEGRKSFQLSKQRINAIGKKYPSSVRPTEPMGVDQRHFFEWKLEEWYRAPIMELYDV